jgi:hypothetical protein
MERKRSADQILLSSTTSTKNNFVDPANRVKAVLSLIMRAGKDLSPPVRDDSYASSHFERSEKFSPFFSVPKLMNLFVVVQSFVIGRV